jgi:hypothetical protein
VTSVLLILVSFRRERWSDRSFSDRYGKRWDGDEERDDHEPDDRTRAGEIDQGIPSPPATAPTLDEPSNRQTMVKATDSSSSPSYLHPPTIRSRSSSPTRPSQDTTNTTTSVTSSTFLNRPLVEPPSSGQPTAQEANDPPATAAAAAAASKASERFFGADFETAGGIVLLFGGEPPHHQAHP